MTVAVYSESWACRSRSKRFKFHSNRDSGREDANAISAVPQCESLWYKLLGGLAIRLLCTSVCHGSQALSQSTRRGVIKSSPTWCSPYITQYLLYTTCSELGPEQPSPETKTYHLLRTAQYYLHRPRRYHESCYWLQQHFYPKWIRGCHILHVY